MNIDNVKKCLLERGYNTREAEVLSEDLVSVDVSLKSCLDAWVLSNEECDFSSHGFSIKGLMENFNLKYPAALLSIDWIIKEPDVAIRAIEKGIR